MNEEDRKFYATSAFLMIDDLKKENEKLRQKIDKAIEYYKIHQQECVIGRNKDEKLIKDYYLPSQCSKVLLNILQGSDSYE